jgi:hypothetical protein
MNHNWLFYLSDTFINSVLVTIAADYKVVSTLVFGPPVVYFLRKLADLTPWKSDNKLADFVSEKLGIEEDKK